MRGILVHIEPTDPATGSKVDVRLGMSRNSAQLSAGNVRWQSGITRAPAFSMELLDEDLSGQVMIGRGDLSIQTNEIQGIGEAQRLDWIGAPVRVWTATGPDVADLHLDFKGRMTSGVIDKNTGILPISMEVDSRKRLESPLLKLDFTGGGGINGDPEFRGRLRAAAFGRPVNVPLDLFDVVNNVMQVDAYGSLLNISNLYEDGAAFGPSIGDAPTYAALVAATVPPGRWATCIALGMIRLGAPPTGVITCDPICNYGTPGTMLVRMMVNHAGIDPALIRTDDFDALDGALATLFSTTPSVSYWTQDQVTVLEMFQRMCASCNAMPLLMLDGTIGVTRIFGGQVAMTVQRKGGERMVTDWRSADPPVPWWRLKMSAEKTYRVHTPSEIDFEGPIVELGDYSSAREYRAGNIVQLPDGSRWLYQALTPVIGSYPTNGNPRWQNLTAPLAAGNIRYEDGTSVEALKPAQPNATEGAPPGTLVGNQEAQDLVQSAAINTEAILEQALRGDDFLQVLDARTLVEGQGVGLVVLSFRNSQTTANSAFQSALNLLGAKTPDGTAWQMNLDQVLVSPGRSFSQHLSEIGLVVDGFSGTVQELHEVLFGPNGMEARAVLKTDVNGNMASLVLSSGLDTGRIGLLAGVTRIAGANGVVLAEFLQDGAVAYIPNLKVDTIQVGTPHSTSAQAISTASSAISGSGSTNYVTVLQHTVVLEAPGSIYSSGAVAMGFPSGDGTYNVRLMIDGEIAYHTGGQKTSDSNAVAGAKYKPAGSYVVQVQTATDSNITTNSRTLFSTVFH